MIKILNQQRQPVAVLENAFGIGYEKVSNQLWSAKFSLPLNDPKNEECKNLYFVELYEGEDEYIGLFRIIPKLTVKNEGTQTVTYQCEHVLATLLDKSFFLYHQIDNLTTRQSIQFVLDEQDVKHWKLGTVEITRYFSYKFENINLLSALFSIPKPFDQQYRWTWDTQSYPWTLNLVIPDDEPTCEITEGKNLIGLEIEENPMGIFNRIYPLGYGEGDNQLRIDSVNNGISYVEDAASVAEYGPREYIWPDKRFEDASILKANAEALLKKWKEPIITWKASAADISKITGEDIHKFKEGRVVRLNTKDFGIVDLRIMKESKSDLTGKPWDVPLELGNLVEDLSTTQSDMERRQQINELYSQGATNLLAYSYNDNCDSSNPAEIVFFLPEEMVRINKLTLWFETTNFRAYEKTIKGGGATTATSSAGGGTSSTSSSGGGTSTSTEGGGSHRHLMLNYISEYGTDLPDAYNNYLAVADASGNSAAALFAPGYNADLYTYAASGSHSHNFSTPNHVHSFSTPNHSHDTTIPDHTHDIEFGIFKLQETPSSVTIRADGNIVPGSSTSGDNIDLIPYLSKDSEGKVNRGKHVITLTPNTLGRINAQVNTQFFMQSRGGGSF